MADYQVIELDNRANSYINKHLKYGHSMSKIVLERLDLNKGRVTIGLPSNANFAKIIDFEHAGILPSVDKSKWISSSTPDGKNYTMKPIPRAFQYTIDVINSFLASNHTSLCVLENANARPSDPYLQKIQSVIWTYQTEVYHVIGMGNKSETIIEKTITESESLWTFVGFLTSLPGVESSPIIRREILKDTLTILAEHVESIIVGAYDGEAFIIWQKNH